MSAADHSIFRSAIPLRVPCSSICLVHWKLPVLIFVLIVEIAALTSLFDTTKLLYSASLDRSETAVVGLDGSTISTQPANASIAIAILSHARSILRAGIVALPLALLLCGRPLLETLARIGTPSFVGYVLPVLACHFGVYFAFTGLTHAVFDLGLARSTWGNLILVSWLGSGVLVVASLVASLFPPVHWLSISRRIFWSFLLAGAAGFACELAGQFAIQLWIPLARLTLDLVHICLSLFELNLDYRPSDFIIGTKPFSVRIAPECSGYEGVGLVLAFLGCYLFLFRHHLRFPHALLLLPVGTVAIWLANVVRITALIEVGTRISEKVALNGFHSQAGWISFIGVAFGLLLMVRKTRFFQVEDAADRSAQGGDGRAVEPVYLAPLMAIVAASIFTGAFSSGGDDQFYPLRLAVVALPLWAYRRDYRAMRWSVSWQSIAIGAIVYLIWIGRSYLSTATGASGQPESAYIPAGWYSLWLLARIIGSVVTVPLAEELAFRGFLTRRLISADFDSVTPGRFTWLSFILSSIAFGSLHHHWAEGVAAGMLYAIAYYRRGSIGDAVVAHATTNAILSAQAALQGDWSIIS